MQSEAKGTITLKEVTEKLVTDFYCNLWNTGDQKSNL